MLQKPHRKYKDTNYLRCIINIYFRNGAMYHNSPIQCMMAKNYNPGEFIRTLITRGAFIILEKYQSFMNASTEKEKS